MSLGQPCSSAGRASRAVMRLDRDRGVIAGHTYPAGPAARPDRRNRRPCVSAGPASRQAVHIRTVERLDPITSSPAMGVAWPRVSTWTCVLAGHTPRPALPLDPRASSPPSASVGRPSPADVRVRQPSQLIVRLDSMCVIAGPTCRPVVRLDPMCVVAGPACRPVVRRPAVRSCRPCPLASHAFRRVVRLGRRCGGAGHAFRFEQRCASPSDPCLSAR